MNELKVIRASSRYIDTPHLVVLIDGEPVDLLVAQILKDETYAGLVTTLDGCLYDTADRHLVWDRILPAARAVAPILVCPDDLDFSCTVVNAQVIVEGHSIRWEHLGVGDPTEPTTIRWWREIGPFHFTRHNYEHFLGDCRALRTEWWSSGGGNQ